MNEMKTSELDALLQFKSLKDYEALLKKELLDAPPSLSSYIESYIEEHKLKKTDIIRDSLVSKDYGYAIMNGNKTNNIERDRIIALCLAMHMTLEEANKALKLSNAGVLYSKNQRDALICIAFNSGEYDVMKLNEMLFDEGMKILETSKEAK